jgi:hypothetical protein
MWNPTPGLYTRYGDVRSLLEHTDDEMVIMGPGDELRLVFDPSLCPKVGKEAIFCWWMAGPRMPMPTPPTHDPWNRFPFMVWSATRILRHSIFLMTPSMNATGRRF